MKMRKRPILLELFLVLLILNAVFAAPEKLRRRKRGWLTGTKPPGTVCTFDPCQIEDFCESGRICELDDNCHHHCRCTPGSTHEMCVSETTDPPKNSTSKSLSISTEFPDGVTTDQISTNSSQTTTTSSEPDSESNNCPPGFPCANGRCESAASTTSGGVEIHCVCDPNWEGTFCEIETFQASCDDVECSESESCIRVSRTQIRCMPKNSTAHACSPDYVMRNVSERRCQSIGLLCVHGRCVQGSDGGSRCECDAGASGLLCRDTCCLDCGENGQCVRNSSGAEVCNCRYNYTGESCNTLKLTDLPREPEQVTWYLWVVGVCVAVLVVLVALMVVLPYVMWRHRVILVMKIVHFFQGYEDDDEREWDAFVSYKADASDEAFVVHTLYPKLEKEMGFRLHLHFKDFIPGDSIANNIIRAVKGSRRTILLITPAFATSEFTRFEYQVAQEEMLKYRHRIIPILLEDISDIKHQLDPNLKQILGSVTYIEWPGTSDERKLEKFWTRLELSLPKKRVDERQSTALAAPEEVEVSVIGEGLSKNRGVDNQGFIFKEDKALRLSSGTTIYDDDDEEVYDTINDDDVRTQVLRKNDVNSQNGVCHISNGNVYSQMTAV